MMLRRFVIAAVTAALLAGCTRAPQSSTARHSWTHAGVLRVAIPQDVKSLDPVLAANTIDGFVHRLLFEPLISADPHGEPVPMLAQTVPSMQNRGISRDGLTVTYHLRPNARWTDGVAVSSADVRYSWSAIMNPGNDAVSRHGYDAVASIGTPDAHTVVVHLKHRFAPFVNTFFAESDQPYEVVPAHILEHYATVNNIPFNARPTVSDGPFRFVSWAHADRIELRRNDGFFMGKPGLQRVDIRVVPDETTSVNLLREHAVDYIYQPSIVTYPLLHGIPDTKIVWVNVNGYEGMQINTSRPPLHDASVRRAILQAIDKNALVRTLTYGQERVATEDIPDWMWAFNPNVKNPPYDPVAASKRLHGLHLLLVTDTANATHRREAVELQAMLRRAGVTLEIKTYPGDLLYAPAGLGGILHGGHFDLSIFPWYSGIDPDDSSQFSCASMPPNGYNDERYCNADMEAAQRQALTNYDRPTRRAAYFKIQQLLARDNPALFFWWQRQQEAISVDFHGFAPNPVTESWNAWQWSI